MLKRIKHLLPFDGRVKLVLPLMRENSSSGVTDDTMLDLTALQNKATKGKLPLTVLTNASSTVYRRSQGVQS